jgi:class 3 adenylate cyclase
MSGLTVTPAETSPSLAAIVATVDPEVVGVRDQTSPEGMVTIVFTDLEESTAMLERLGEERWLDLMATHNRLVRNSVAEHSGEVVKSQGDGFMLAFASASASLAWAVRIQRILARYNTSHPDQPLRMRIGAHTGNIFQAESDYLGRAVVLAARITGRAVGGQILVSAACREYTKRAGPWRYGGPAELALKGLASVELVYSLEWAEEV